jgi:hypothetical protein
LAQTPDHIGGDALDGQQTPISLDNDSQLNPDTDSLDRRLLEHQNQDQQQQHASSSDVEASSLIKLDNGDVLYMREVNR